MEIPFISIIIPVYNGSKTLNECLNAVYSSTFQDFEVLIIDDLSTDNSMEIAIRFPGLSKSMLNSPHNLIVVKEKLTT